MAEVSNDSNVVTGGQAPVASPGSSGMNTQVPGAPTTVSAAAAATGGVGPGHFIEEAIDRELFQFESDNTPLMQLMLAAKSVPVKSPVIKHYSIDEPRTMSVTTAAVGDGTAPQVVLPVANTDQQMFSAYTTVLVKGVDGYAEDGKTPTPGKELMLFISGRDAVSNNPIARAVNGPKTNEGDESCNVPAIPAGSIIIIMANALFETQKEVLPDLIVPQPTTVYAQKRGMNSIISDYFDKQEKRIPFSQALIAEAQIRAFKIKGNNTLWSSRPGRFVVETDLGVQTIYTTEGVLYQIKRHLDHTGKWTYEQLIALAKMIFTGNDVPKSVVVLGGKNFVECMQCIDFSKHPEIKIDIKTNKLGWTVSTIHTVFGDFEIKHDPSLDGLGLSNSAAVIAYDRLVHYIYKQEHKDSERVTGHEATREATLVWDALALKGSCHIWIDGEGRETGKGVTTYALWDSAEAPESPVANKVYVLLADCPGIAEGAVTGTMWVHDGAAWKEYSGELVA